MKNLTFGSVCSGIEAASVAWHDLGMQAAWLAEIEAFPSAVLAHHYPSVPNLGDMTKIAAAVRGGSVPAPDVLVGGTPCQAFSVAGLRGGLSDPRGALTLAYVDLANAIDSARSVRGEDPCAVVWENVPGVLSSKDNAFGCFLGALAGEICELEPEPRPAAGKSSRHWRWDKGASAHTPSWPLAGCVFGPQRSIAWRVLDAQYFGVAQRRRRVFVVASARTGFDPAAVLFELEGVRRDSAPSREAGENLAADAGSSAAVPDGSVVSSLDASFGRLQGCSGQDMNHGHSHLVPTAFGGNRTGGPIDITPALLAQGGSGYKGDFESETFLVNAAYVAPVAPTLSARSKGGGGLGTDFDCDGGLVAGAVPCITGDITHTLKADGFDASEDGTGRGTPIVPVAGTGVQYHYCSHDYAHDRVTDISGVNPALTREAHASGNLNVLAPIAFPANLSGTQCASAEDLSPALGALNPTAVAFSCKDHGADAVADIAPTMRAMGHAGSHANGGGQLAVAVALRGRDGGATAELGDEVQNCLRASGGGGDKAHVLAPVAVGTDTYNGSITGDVAATLGTQSGDGLSSGPSVMQAMQVRRLTPRECERLQAFPDDYTRIPNWNGWRKLDEGETPEQLAAEGLEVKQNAKTGKWRVKDVDGPRYKALGNSMCVFNMRWIGRRLVGALA